MRKSYVKASSTVKDDIDKYLNAAIRNVANYAYDISSWIDDDPRSDYFIENVCGDLDVKKAKEGLYEALLVAINRAKGYR